MIHRLPLTALLCLISLLVRADEMDATNATNSVQTSSPPIAGNNLRPTPIASTPAAPMPMLPVGGMQLRSGFRIQLAAAEPEIVNPIAMAFDADGRLFVIEEKPFSRSGRIKRLEDADGDGRFEKSVIFADQINKPTALVCYGSGLFVACGDEVIFLTDTDNDDKADVRRTIFNGFTPQAGATDARITHLVWGPDNRVHAACKDLTGIVSCIPSESVKPIDIERSDFAFDPRSLVLTREDGGKSLGLGFDDGGRRFTTTANAPIKFTLTEPELASQNPLYVWPQLSTNLAASDWKIFPLYPAPNSAMATEGIQAARYTTNAFVRPNSLMVYRGSALPSEYKNSVFVTDPELRLVSQWSLREGGIVPRLWRPSTGRSAEFLTTRDPSFRPVQVLPAPDGSIVIADLGRINLDKPEERGRIWRILPSAMQPAAAPHLSAMPSSTLLDLLTSGNGWVRDTAARLLFERNDPTTLEAAAKKLRWSYKPLEKWHLLQLLASVDQLDETQLLRALQDKDTSVRSTAIQITKQFVKKGELAPPLLGQLGLASRDASPRVRFETALVAGTLNDPVVPILLANAVAFSPDDPLIQSAVLTSAHTDVAAALLGRLVGNSQVYRSSSGWAFLRSLAWMAGTQDNVVLDNLLIDLDNSGLNFADELVLASDVGEGMYATGRRLLSSSSTNQSQILGYRALHIALEGTSAELRADAIRFLGVSGYEMKGAGDWVLAFMVPGESETVQKAAADALSYFPDPRVASSYVQRWSRLSGGAQRVIITRMLEQFDRTEALLDGLQNGRISVNALTEVQMNFLRNHPNPNTAERALQILGPINQDGAANQFAGALKLKGSPSNGRRIFQNRCASCHEFKGEGRSFGPDLNLASGRSRERLMEDIVEPSREMRPEYQTQVVHRRNDKLLFGIVHDSGPDFIMLDQADGQRVFLPRTRVEQTYKQNWSLMPANAASGLSITEVADLLAYLTTKR